MNTVNGMLNADKAIWNIKQTVGIKKIRISKLIIFSNIIREFYLIMCEIFSPIWQISMRFFF